MKPNIRVAPVGSDWWLTYDETTARQHFNFPAGPFSSQQEAVTVALRCAGMVRASVTIQN